MPNPYYQLPLRLDQIILKKRHGLCSLTDSIAQNLHLILSTYRGEASFSEDFGCSVWDEEFNIQLNLRWKEDLCDSLKHAIGKFEKRLNLLDVKGSLEEHNERIGKDNCRIRKRLRIEIIGTVKKTNESFNFRDTIYISPVAQK